MPSDTATSTRLAIEPRTVVITGAGQGLGRAFALRLAVEGLNVGVADIAEDKAQKVAGEIAAAGGKAIAVGVDVSEDASVAAMVKQVVGRFGSLDVLVNNAAIFSTLKMRPFFEIPLDEWQKVIDVNLTGVFLCARHAYEPMRQRGWGRIINISSGVVPVGRANYMHYVASKAGVVGVTRAMARELGGFGITVNAILPGATQTEIPRDTVTPEQRKVFIAMQSLQRAQVPEDLSGVVSFLASDDSRFMTGQSLIVDGGMTFN